MEVVLVYKEISGNRDFYNVVFCKYVNDPLFNTLYFSQLPFTEEQRDTCAIWSVEGTTKRNITRTITIVVVIIKTACNE